jgi:signal peptidase
MKVFLKVLKGIVTVFLVIVLLLVIFQKVTNNKIAVGNIYIFEVASASMAPEYKVGDVIVVKKADANEINVGDDVTYLGKESNLSGLIVTHRVISEREENGVKYFTTKGIANNIEDPEIEYNDIYGKVSYHTIIFSFVGRLMTNIVVYYLLFIAVGVSFAYEVVSSFIIKDEDDEEDIEKNEE